MALFNFLFFSKIKLFDMYNNIYHLVAINYYFLNHLLQKKKKTVIKNKGQDHLGWLGDLIPESTSRIMYAQMHPPHV